MAIFDKRNGLIKAAELLTHLNLTVINIMPEVKMERMQLHLKLHCKSRLLKLLV